MASPVEKELEKHLECGICLERYQDPKVLRCQHSYCRKPCLEKLVIRNEITCPECRRKTEVAGGDVNRLPSNFLINSLLSIGGNGQSKVSPSCKKHDGEILKLFCQSCDQLICRDCTVIDHRDHRYTFIKDILPAAKKEISEVIKKSRENICTLESAVGRIKEEEDDLHKNSMKVNCEIDSFINKQIEILERKRRGIKDDLQKSVTAQKKYLDDQIETFEISLCCLKSSVEFTEEALSKGSEVEILSAKNRMIQELAEVNSVTQDLKLQRRIYKLEEDWPLNDDSVFKRMVKIRERDKEFDAGIDNTYELLMISDLGGLSKNLVTLYQGRHVYFNIRLKSKGSKTVPAIEVQVTITTPSKQASKVEVTKKQDDSFRFSFDPKESGVYEIVVLIDERSVHGSPFIWKVIHEID